MTTEELCKKHGTEDPHVALACELFGIRPEHVGEQLRLDTKFVAFGGLYGGQGRFERRVRTILLGTAPTVNDRLALTLEFTRYMSPTPEVVASFQSTYDGMMLNRVSPDVATHVLVTLLYKGLSGGGWPTGGVVPA